MAEVPVPCVALSRAQCLAALRAVLQVFVDNNKSSVYEYWQNEVLADRARACVSGCTEDSICTEDRDCKDGCLSGD